MPSRRGEIERQIHNVTRRIETVQGHIEMYTLEKDRLSRKKRELLEELKNLK